MTSNVPPVFPDQLRSARLKFRILTVRDATALSAYRSKPEVARYQSWESYSEQDAIRLLEDQPATGFIPGTWFQLGIIEASNEELIGDCGLHCLQSDPRQVELGITLAPAMQGRGYATEAVECLLDHMFSARDTHRVFATTDALNASAVALFRRLGFRQEAHFREHLWFKGSWGSEFVFAILKKEWDE